MRFRKGTNVEVLTQKEVPSGSWRRAEIIGGFNSHNYTVRYEPYDGDVDRYRKTMLDSVPRKAVRPCPPSVDMLEDWMPGDVVEVFHNFSWKMATVLKALGWNYLVVRLLGSAIEFKANKYDVRARLCWQDDEWIVIGKASGKCEDVRFRLPSSRKDNNQSNKTGIIMSRRIKGDHHVSTKNVNCVLESQAIPSRTLKRKPSRCHPEIEAYEGRYQKVRVGKKHKPQSQQQQKTQCNPSEMGSGEGRMYAVLTPILEKRKPQLAEKVDDVTCSREQTEGVFGYSRSMRLEYNDDVSISSSVGSCSVFGNFSHKFHHGFTTESSDAESFCQLRSEKRSCLFPAKEELGEEIHRLELHAYHCIIEALHASGPLSWEQELLLTNLRDSLHISNDEHLMEIRNLVSSNAYIPCS